MKKVGTKKRWAEFLNSYPNCRIRDRMNEIGLKSNNLSDLMNEVLSEDMKITSDAVRQWVGGYTRPDIARLAAIAEALDCSIDYLMGREGQPSKIETDIVAKTGLSAKAVNRLCSINNNSDKSNQLSRSSLEALSVLLESDFSFELLRAMYLYFYMGKTINISIHSSTQKDDFTGSFECEIKDILNEHSEEYCIIDFKKIIQDAQLVKIQEKLLDIRREINRR